ncbi:hypothetical protein Emag_001433 [Eimeria magna]
MVKELQLVGTQLKVPKPPETKKEEESVKHAVEEKKETERKQQVQEAAEVEKTEKKEEGEKEEGEKKEKEKAGGEDSKAIKSESEEQKTFIQMSAAVLNDAEDDIDKDDAGGGIGGTSFVWNDLKQFLVYAMLRAALQSLAYALTHPAQSDQLPTHLISRLATDCYFLGKHPDVQAKVEKAAEGVEEAKGVKRFDKYFAGYIATCCNALAIEVYQRTMKEKELGDAIEKDGFDDKLKEALAGMTTWRNRTIVPELEKKGMEPPGVKEMQGDVIRESMDNALKSKTKTRIHTHTAY